MAWHDETPWKRRQEEQIRRLDEAERVVDSMRRGVIPFRAGWPLLIEIARGESDRVIRTGESHTPDIEGDRQ